jgi:hypothetical protein
MICVPLEWNGRSGGWEPAPCAAQAEEGRRFTRVIPSHVSHVDGVSCRPEVLRFQVRVN